MIKEQSRVSSRDLAIITRQLGRRPRGEIRVACRCDFGCPLVIVSPPRLDGVYHPTTYWLTCPVLVKNVSRLEGEGWIRRLQSRLVGNKSWQRKLAAATAAQRACRRLLADQDELEWRGIAGVRELTRVKCLHAHYADYLVGGLNPIGAAVATGLKETTVAKAECSC